MKNEEKAALRRQLRSLRPERETIARESSLICERLLGWPAYRRHVLGSLYGHGPRSRRYAAADYALAQHKKLLLPRIADGEMRFYRVTDLDTLVAGTFGIREPAQDAPEAALEEAQLILTPLEAVDGRGCRLGKGGGYYDRALRTRKGVALGVALCYQVVERVPTTDRDEPLDGWVTAREIHILTKAR